MSVFSPRFGWFAASQIPNRPQKWRDLAILIILDTLFVIQLAAITELERLKDELRGANPLIFVYGIHGFGPNSVHFDEIEFILFKNVFFWFDYAHWIWSEMDSNRFLQSRKCISRGVAFLFFWFSVLYSGNLDFTILRSCSCYSLAKYSIMHSHNTTKSHILRI